MTEFLVVLLIFLVSIIAMLICAVWKSSIHVKFWKLDFNMDSFFIGPFCGAIIVLLFGLIPLSDALKGLWSFSGLNPVGILTLFFSMVYISKYLDTTGFFQFCAIWSLSKSGKSSTKLYFIIYVVVSILTIFTSNDVVILTFTPFIHYFTKAAGINPVPFLFGEFFAANTWSMIFIISNPTNVVLGTAFKISFSQYAKAMILPSIVGGVSNCLILFFLFRKNILQEFKLNKELGDPMQHVRSKFDMYVALAFTSITIFFMAVSSTSWFKYEMWHVSGVMAATLLLYNIFNDIFLRNPKDPVKMKQIFSTLPYPIIPFLLSLFVLVNALKLKGFFTSIGEAVAPLANINEPISITLFGVLSVLSANILNNIPMSVAYVPIIQATKNPPSLGAVYAAVVGSNLGANLTPLGALAGIMWLGILKSQKIHIGFMEFVKVGFIATPICFACTMLPMVLMNK